jgi:hypothetical protein
MRRWILVIGLGVGTLALVALIAVLTGGGDDTAEHRAPTTTSRDTSPSTSSTSPPTTARNTPEDAIKAFLASRGYAYVGDCSDADDPATTPIGSWCSLRYEDHGDSMVYGVGPVFSEPWGALTVVLGSDGAWIVDLTGQE